MDLVQGLQQTTDAAATLIADAGSAGLARPSNCEGWDVKALVNHMTSVCQRFAVSVSGEGTAPAPNADLLGDDPAGAYRAAAAASVAAYRKPGVLEREVNLPSGATTGQGACGVQLVDQLQHVWDLSKALGKPYPLGPELATQALEMSRARIGPDRRGPGKPFGAEVPVPADAPIQDRLAGFLGRQV